MDKKNLLGIGIITLLLTGFLLYNSSKAKKEQAAQLKKEQMALDSLNNYAKAHPISKPAMVETGVVVKDSILNKPDSSAISNAELEAKTKFGDFYKQATGAEARFTIENELIRATLNSKGGEIERLELKNYKTWDGKPLILFDKSYADLSIIVPLSGGQQINTHDMYFQALDSSFVIKGEEKRSFRFRLQASDKSYIDQVYTFRGNSYLFDYQILFTNMQSILPQNMEFMSLKWNDRATRQEKTLKTERLYSSVFYRLMNGDVEQLDPSETEESEVESVQWISFKQQFFNTTLFFDKGFKGKLKTEFNKDDTAYLKKYSADMIVPFKNTDAQLDFRFFTGPNQYHLLKKTSDKFEDILQLGSTFSLLSWNKYINTWVFIPLMTLLAKWGLQYGIILLIIAIVIKLVTLPLTLPTTKNGEIMKAIRPDVEALREKHKDDPQKFQMENMKLMQSVGVSVMAGCLPAILQLIIFTALASFFPASIELRQQSFLWVNDLSSFDDLIHWGSFHIPLIGEFSHISIFAITMSLSSLLMTLVNPQQFSTANNDPSQALMKYMPYYLPVIFFFVFNNMSAAMAYYYTLLNLLSIGQQVIFKKFFFHPERINSIIQQRRSKPQKKGFLQAKLEEMQKLQQEQMKQKGKK